MRVVVVGWNLMGMPYLNREYMIRLLNFLQNRKLWTWYDSSYLYLTRVFTD